MTITEAIEDVLVNGAKDQWGLIPSDSIVIKLPPNPELGDFAVECFKLAQVSKVSPTETAKVLTSLLEEKSSIVEKAVAMGPYVNLTLDRGFLFSAIANQQLEKKGDNNKTVMVEYLSPNTNKPLHLGHMRNGVLGLAVANLLDWTGSKVVKSCLVNDRGVHICKSMLAWKLFGNGETPASTGKKGDHFVGDYYVMFSQKAKEDPSLEIAAREMLAKWEVGDEETVDIWNKMNGWVYKGFNETYGVLGFDFDVIYKESETYHLGKDIVAKGLVEGTFKHDASGAVVYALPKDKFDLNKDGSEEGCYHTA